MTASTIARAWIALALTLAGTGCRERPTQVFVRLATDIEDLDQIHLVIQDAEEGVLREETYFAEVLEDILPGEGFQEIGSFGIVPSGGDPSRRFRVSVTVQGRSSGGEVRTFETAARSSFLSNRLIRLDIFLAQRCLDTEEECEEGFTCGVDECVPEEVDPNTLPRLDQGPLFDPRTPRDGGVVDAGLDGALDPDAPPPGPPPQLRFPHSGFRAPGNELRVIWDPPAGGSTTGYEVWSNGEFRLAVDDGGPADVRVDLPSGRNTLEVVPCAADVCDRRAAAARVVYADRPRCDLDGDGRSDIAFSWRGTTDESYLSAGDTNSLPLSGPTACGDLDDDGNDELIVGSGRADPELGTMRGLLPDMPSAVLFADTDGDGRQELFYAVRATGEIKRMDIDMAVSVVGTGFTVGRQLVAADTDADGVLEVLLAGTSGTLDDPGPVVGLRTLAGVDVPVPGARPSLFGDSVAALGPGPGGRQAFIVSAPLETQEGLGHMPGAAYVLEEVAGGSPRLTRVDAPDPSFSNFPTSLSTHDPLERSFVAGFGVFERHPPDPDGMHQGHVYLFECAPDCVPTPLPPMPPEDDSYFGSTVIGNLDLDDDGQVDLVAIARHLPRAETTRIYRRLAARGTWEFVAEVGVAMDRTWAP